MKRFAQKTMLLLGVGVLAAACATQPVAPVVGGYGKTGRKVASTPRVVKVSPTAPLKGAPATQQAITSTPLAPYRVAATAEKTPDQLQQAQPAAPQPVAMVSHTVKNTETLYKIASDYNASASGILAANGLKRPSDIRPGQVLQVPSNSNPRLTAMDFVRQALSSTQTASAQQATGNVATIEPAAGPSSASYSPVEGRQVASLLPRTAAAKAVTPAEAPVAETTYITHAVQPKETIFRISQTYKVSVFDIMAANAFDTPQDLKAGTRVRVPVASKVAVAAVPTPPAEVALQKPATPEKPVEKAAEKQPETAAAAPQAMPGSPDDVPQTASVFSRPKPKSQKDVAMAELKRGQVDEDAANAPGMVWPVRGKLLQRFGDAANGVSHTGISIAVPPGTSVLASDAGTVLYADEGLKAYGKLVLIRHSNGMVSAYAHNSHLLVRKGERVKKGQIIAASGSTGNVADPQLHFELRQHASAVDPLRILPKL